MRLELVLSEEISMRLAEAAVRAGYGGDAEWCRRHAETVLAEHFAAEPEDIKVVAWGRVGWITEGDDEGLWLRGVKPNETVLYGFGSNDRLQTNSSGSAILSGPIADKIIDWHSMERL